MTTQIDNSRAGQLIERVRILLMLRTSPDLIEQNLAEEFGIQPLRTCAGSAHRDANALECPDCVDHIWGICGLKVEVAHSAPVSAAS